MDDERLLSEALRAHAAGGVSSPGGTPNAAPTPTPSDDGASPNGSRLRDRFRPLGRKRDTADAPETVAHPTPAAPPTGPAGTAGTAGTAGPYPPPPRTAPPTARPTPGPPPGPPHGPVDRPRGPGGPPGALQAGPPPGRPGAPMPTGPVNRPPGPGVPQQRPAPGAAPPPTSSDESGPADWTPVRIAWWAGIALLGGAIAGALAAVGTLGLPG